MTRGLPLFVEAKKRYIAFSYFMRFILKNLHENSVRVYVCIGAYAYRCVIVCTPTYARYICINTRIGINARKRIVYMTTT